MGSCLSPLLAEIFMAKIENSLQSYHSIHKVFFFKRYVDDIFCIFDGTASNLDDIFTLINSLHESITFTMELESKNSLPFLDILCTKLDNHIDLSIYHKPTSTDSIIPFDSNHPFNQKMAALNCFFTRLYNIPMSQSNFNNELSWIRTVAINNKFPPSIINKTYFNHFRKFINKNLIVQEDKITSKFFSIPFFGGISLQLRNLFSLHNVNICFKVSHTSSRFLCNSKDLTPLLNRSGVYQLTCCTPNCNSRYVGQTGRKFSTRIHEHLREFDKFHKKPALDATNMRSNFARHLHFNNHIFTTEEGFKSLHFCDKGNLMSLLEVLEIGRAIEESTPASMTSLTTLLQHFSSP